jgi:regulator of protease activity HflC (stomatin/prohibitin superfamily)
LFYVGEVRTFEYIAAQIVRDTGAKYLAFDYFEVRETLNKEMREALNLAFNRMYCTVTTFQLTNLEVPAEFADAIEATQVAIQDIYVAEYEQEKTIFIADGLREVAVTLANITIMEANATAESQLREVEAESNALLYRIEQQAASLFNLTSEWGLSPEEALSYMHMAAIQESGASSVTMGIPYPEAFRFLN